jgi:(S)-2-hydroxy-acid oxidase
VFLAQPILWGLTYDGQKGAEDVFGIVVNEFDNTMALAGIYLYLMCYLIEVQLNWMMFSGCVSIDQIKKEMVVHESVYSKL